MAPHQITINLDFYAHKCQAAIQARLHELQLVLNAHDTGVAGAMGENFTATTGIRVSVATPDSTSALQNAFQNAILGANRDFTRYCEELMAIRELKKEPPTTLTADQANIPAHELIGQMIDERATKIGQTPSIKAPDKLKAFLPETDRAFLIGNSHIQLRNTIEHHNSRPKANLAVIVYALFMNFRVGETFNSGDQLHARYSERTILYSANQRIVFQYEDVKDIITTTDQVLLRAVHEAMLRP